MTVKVKLRLKDLGNVDPKDAWCHLPSGAPEHVTYLLGAAIGMNGDDLTAPMIPIWDQKELKKILRKAVSERFVKKDKSVSEAVVLAQFRILIALNVGSRELLKALVSNMNEDYGEVINEISVCRETNVGRA